MPIVFVVLLVGIAAVLDATAKAVIPLPWPIPQRLHRVQTIGALPTTVIVSGISLVADVVVAYSMTDIHVRACGTNSNYFRAFLLTAPALLVALWRWLGQARLYESYDPGSTMLRRPSLVALAYAILIAAALAPAVVVSRQVIGPCLD